MNCERAGELLIDLLYGELDGPSRADLLKHLATCRCCADEYASLRRARSALGRLAAGEPPMRPLALGEGTPRAARVAVASRFRRWRLVAGVAAAALILGVLVALLHHHVIPTAIARDMPVEIKRTGVSLTILSRPPEWDRFGDDDLLANQGLVQHFVRQLPGPVQPTVQTAMGAAGNPVTYFSRWPGLALVRDQRIIRHIRPGEAEVRFTDVPAGIWADSVRLRCLDGGQDLAVLEQNYQFDLASAEAVLAKHVDQTVGIRFKDGQEARGTLLSFDPNTLVIRPAGEGPRTIARQQIAAVTFEKLPQGLLTTPTLVWQLANSGQADERQFEVDYLTTGLSWRADYVVKLRPATKAEASDAKSAIVDHADLVGYATVVNKSGVTYEDAQLKLMAGDVNLLIRPSGYLLVWNGIEGGKDSNGEPEQMEEKSFFEYHLYTLTRPTTIANNETKQLEMVSGQGLALRRAYVYDPGENPTAARVVSEMENTEANGLGKPLPKGVVRLYAPDPEGVQTYVAQTEIDHTPVKEKLRLPWGHAFDIACQWREVNTRHAGDDHQITAECSLRNHKAHDVTVTVIVHVPPSTYAAECALPWHVREVGVVEVTAVVPAGRETKFTFSHRFNNLSGGGLRSPYGKE